MSTESNNPEEQLSHSDSKKDFENTHEASTSPNVHLTMAYTAAHEYERTSNKCTNTTNQKLIVIKLSESIDTGSRSHNHEKKTYPLSELTENAKIIVSESWGQPNPNDADDTVHIVYEMEGIHLTDEKMDFTFCGDRYTLNRQWQVLGTDSFDVPNAYIHISERFIFYFGTASKDGEDIDDQLQDLYDEMSDNAEEGKYWKNIPLARQGLQLMKDCNPELENIPCHAFCELVIKEELLNPLNTPRLILSVMDFQHVLFGSDYKWSQEAYKLRIVTGPNATEKDIEDYISKKSHLKHDPIELSQEWEDNIYEVEKELEDLFKNEKRHRGFCHSYWSAKREALAKRGITWRSPSRMNPRTKFD